jgi:predicted Zn-dependent protease
MAATELGGPFPGRAWATLVALWLLGAGCIQNDGRRLNPFVSDTSGPEGERELGVQFDRQLLEQVEIIDDPVVVDAIGEMGQSIVRQIEPQPFLYRFRVVVDPQLNAFAVPGGFIYLHSGTVLQAGSVDELAGVLGHEIGHVKGHHIARLQSDAAIPNILTTLAGVGAAVATGEPGFVLAAQGVNVALRLKYTRVYEDEADRIGSVFMARAGYDPVGITSFFERIVRSRPPGAAELPPYLYSHPQVEDRIETVERLSAGLTRSDQAPALTDEQLRNVQARLAILVAEQRSSWPSVPTPTPSPEVRALLTKASELAETERLAEALALLDRAERLDAANPHIPFRRGETLMALGRPEPAAEAYRRAVYLDPSRGLTYYQLAQAYKKSRDPVRASLQLDQAIRRLSDGGALEERARAELEQLTFPVIESAGFSTGPEPGELAVRAPVRIPDFRVDGGGLTWWGAVGSRWMDLRDKIIVRWSDPEGRIVQEEPARPEKRPYVASSLRFSPEHARQPGDWRVEAILRGETLDERRFGLSSED